VRRGGHPVDLNGKGNREEERRSLDSLDDDAGHGQAQAAPGVPSLERQQRESNSLHPHSPLPSIFFLGSLKGRAFLGFGLDCQFVLD
jgi:hypothetical protein